MHVVIHRIAEIRLQPVHCVLGCIYDLADIGHLQAKLGQNVPCLQEYTMETKGQTPFQHLRRKPEPIHALRPVMEESVANSQPPRKLRPHNALRHLLGASADARHDRQLPHRGAHGGPTPIRPFV